MTIALPSPIELHQHDPLDLVALLESHSPRSLPVLSTIYENLSLPSGSTSTSSAIAREAKYGVVYSTFPPLSKHADGEDEEGVWAVVVQMQDPVHTHLRLFCSADSSSNCNYDAEEVHRFMAGVGDTIVRIWGKEVILGALESRWFEVLRGKLDADDVVECTVFLAPPSLPGGSEGDTQAGEVKSMGLTFDQGRPGDVDRIRRTCDVPRPEGYYLSRNLDTTALRTQGGEAVCWVMHHTDGSLGALYTLPAWRRRGLAKHVVQRRIRDRHQAETATEIPMTTRCTKTTVAHDTRWKGRGRDFCYVFKGNAASEALWRRMGWEEGWGVKWVVNRHVGRERGQVVMHRDEGE